MIRDGCVHVDGEEHHHLAVARAEPGEAIEVFDGKGNVWSAVVESSSKRETLARVKEARRAVRDPREVILALAIIRIGAFELALEKAVEIGIRRIVPFTASRSNLAPGHRHDRWARILIEAAKQSKHYYMPALDEPKSFEQVLSLPAASRIVFAESGGGPLKPPRPPRLCVVKPWG